MAASLFVVTDWMAKQMYDLGYLQEINHEDIQTVFDNLLPQFEPTPTYDPERKFSIPWQGGLTGVWVDTAKAPEITSVNDLFDPKYKGQVTMLTEMRDTVPLVLQATASSSRRRRSRTGSRRSTRSGRPPTPARSAASRATSTPRT